MNKLGMGFDTAHCSPETLRGVLSESSSPVILSHTGAYALRRLSRHVQDSELRAVARPRRRDRHLAPPRASQHL